MTPRSPGFLDEDGGAIADAQGSPAAPGLQTGVQTAAAGGHEDAAESPALPRGPMLLDPEPDAPARVDVGWTPEMVAAPPARIGPVFWIAAGLSVLVASWAVLSMASFVVALMLQSVGLGILAMAGVGLGCALLLYAMLLEVRAYRSLGTVERLRAVLASSNTTVEAARAQAISWLHQVGDAAPERAAVERMLQKATTVAEVRGILRSQVADRLREAAGVLGRRAAVEGATLVAICPHPAWDGVFAGGRGLLVIRHVAALYGLRPGLAVTLALMRRVAWTAAGTTGLSLVSQGLADHALASMPVLKHLAGALPGTGAVAVRLYRLAGVTAETCSPVS